MDPGAAGRPQPREVLVVDDDEAMAEFIEGGLDGLAPELCIHRVGSLADAHDHLERGPPAALVVDLVLPDGDGMDLVRHVRVTLGWAGIPIVVMSGWSPARDREARRAGATAYLAKPRGLKDLDRMAGTLVRAVEAGHVPPRPSWKPDVDRKPSGTGAGVAHEAG